jgi:hypothetical protein
VNVILEHIHVVLMNMLHTAEMDMADSVKTSDIDVFLTDAALAIRSTYHAVLKASPGAAIFGRDMLFDIPFIFDWKKIGEHRQLLTDRYTSRENEGRIDLSDTNHVHRNAQSSIGTNSPASGQEPTSECNTGAYSCCLNEHVMHS